jgi:uncharacterized integral membrane protein
VPDLSHLWQRLLRATALVFGLVVGVAVTVFAYSNTATVDVGWATLHFHSVPLWTVAVVPLVVVLAVGALYHWFNNLHHFTEHMKHRRRVKELEAELASLRSHLDTALEMPDHDAVGTAIVTPPEVVETVAPAPATEAATPNGEEKPARKDRKRPTVMSDTEPVAVTDSEAKPEETPAET